MIESNFGPVIAVIGDLMLDQYVKGDVARISPEAPVPILLHRENSSAPGGAANVAANIAAMGGAVSLVGVVGKDQAAEDLRRDLGAYPEVMTDGLIADEDRPTTTKMRLLAGRQQLLRVDKETPVGLSASTAQQLMEAAMRAVL